MFFTCFSLVLHVFLKLMSLKIFSFSYSFFLDKLHLAAWTTLNDYSITSADLEENAIHFPFPATCWYKIRDRQNDSLEFKWTCFLLMIVNERSTTYEDKTRPIAVGHLVVQNQYRISKTLCLSHNTHKSWMSCNF